MSSVVKTGVFAHDNACLAALGTLQAALIGTPTQAQINSAYIVFHRAVVASAKANNMNNGMGPSLDALRGLGVNA